MLQILEVTKEDEGAYRCVASNSARREISHAARLTVTTGTALLWCFNGVSLASQAPLGAARHPEIHWEFEDPML